MYHDNPRTNNVILAVINDGNGGLCGMTYEERCQSVDNFTSVLNLRKAARVCADRLGINLPFRPDSFEAGNILSRYYQDHVKECR